MNTSKNDITGDSLVTKTTSDAYRTNFDAIFRKKSDIMEPVTTKDEYEENKCDGACMCTCDKSSRRSRPF